MYTDRNTLAEYAFHGAFYKKDVVPSEDGDLINGGEESEVLILDTECDIQETNKLFTSGVVTQGYTIYFPTPSDDDGVELIPEALKPGVRFRGEMYGMPVEGMVIGVYPTQMHGCVAYIKGTDV